MGRENKETGRGKRERRKKGQKEGDVQGQLATSQSDMRVMKVEHTEWKKGKKPKAKELERNGLI